MNILILDIFMQIVRSLQIDVVLIHSDLLGHFESVVIRPKRDLVAQSARLWFGWEFLVLISGLFVRPLRRRSGLACNYQIFEPI